MRCLICRNGETKPGFATVTLEREGMIVVVKNVPARVCENCAEEYVDEDVATQLFETAEGMARTGAQLGVHEYRAA